MTATETTDWYGPDTATFGDRLTGARETAGLSAEEFAHRIGVRRKTVEAWEDDHVDPRANRLTMMAGMLNVSIRWLLTGEGEGLDAPADTRATTAAIRDDANAALAELASLRGRVLALAHDLGKAEKRLRPMLRAATASPDDSAHPAR